VHGLCILIGARVESPHEEVEEKRPHWRNGMGVSDIAKGKEQICTNRKDSCISTVHANIGGEGTHPDHTKVTKHQRHSGHEIDEKVKKQ